MNFSGACVAVTLLTELLKELLDGILPVHIPTRLLSYGIAVVLLLLGSVFTGCHSAQQLVLCFVNGAFVSLSSNGSFDLIKDFTDSEDK